MTPGENLVIAVVAVIACDRKNSYSLTPATFWPL